MGFGIKIKVGRNHILRKPLGTGKGSANEVAKKLQKVVKDAGKKINKTASKTLSDISAEATRAKESLDRSMTKTADNLNRELTYVKEDIDDAATSARENLEVEAKRLKEDIDREATKAKKSIDKEASRAKGKLDKKATELKNNIDKEAARAKRDIDTELLRLKDNIDREATKLKSDIDRELTDAREDVDEAVDAAIVFVETQYASTLDTLSEAEQLVEEGKLLDAVWHVATEPAQDTKDNFVKAVTSSELLGQVAAIGASAYGGPAGAAAYAAWLTYETTGSLDHAIKAGIISGIATSGEAYATSIKGSMLADNLKREIVKASVNACAVAASGGSQEDIEDAFMSSALDSIRNPAQAAIQTWAQESIAPLFETTDTPDFTETNGASLIQKAKAISDEVQELRDQWDEINRAATVMTIAAEAVTNAG